MFDCVIIGKGPAGITGSLYAVRAGLRTLVVAKSASPLEKSGKIDNYFGFAAGIAGGELMQAGENQALRLGVEFTADEVFSITSNEEGFTVNGSKDDYKAKTVIIATGLPHKSVNIDNYDKYTGKGVSYCTTCDGYFYKGLKVGIVGSGDFALHEALEMLELAKEVTIFTNGKNPDFSDSMMSMLSKVSFNMKEIVSFDGAEFLERIRFNDGTEENIDGVFLALESASGADFARQLGVVSEGTAIVVDKDQKTNVEGLFAAGDCTGGIRQIAVAVGQGAVAGKRASEYMHTLNRK